MFLSNLLQVLVKDPVDLTDRGVDELLDAAHGSMTWAVYAIHHLSKSGVRCQTLEDLTEHVQTVCAKFPNLVANRSEHSTAPSVSISVDESKSM